MSMLLSQFVPPSPSLLGRQVHSLRCISIPALQIVFFFFLKRSCFVGEIVILFIYYLFWPCSEACRVLVP